MSPSLISRACAVPTPGERIAIYKARASREPDYSPHIEAARAKRGMRIQRQMRTTSTAPLGGAITSKE